MVHKRRTKIVAPPFGEQVAFAHGAEDREVEDERDDLGAAIERARNDVIVCRGLSMKLDKAVRENVHFVNQRGYLRRIHHWDRMPRVMVVFTDVLMPTGDHC